LTLGSNKIGDLVSNWHVSDETSLSDHRYICFQIVTYQLIMLPSGIPREPNGSHTRKT
jgi:hypothetical protein